MTEQITDIKLLTLYAVKSIPLVFYFLSKVRKIFDRGKQHEETLQRLRRQLPTITASPAELQPHIPRLLKKKAELKIKFKKRQEFLLRSNVSAIL